MQQQRGYKSTWGWDWKLSGSEILPMPQTWFVFDQQAIQTFCEWKSNWLLNKLKRTLKLVVDGQNWLLCLNPADTLQDKNKNPKYHRIHIQFIYICADLTGNPLRYKKNIYFIILFIILIVICQIYVKYNFGIFFYQKSLSFPLNFYFLMTSPAPMDT